MIWHSSGDLYTSWSADHCFPRNAMHFWWPCIQCSEPWVTCNDSFQPMPPRRYWRNFCLTLQRTHLQTLFWQKDILSTFCQSTINLNEQYKHKTTYQQSIHYGPCTQIQTHLIRNYYVWFPKSQSTRSSMETMKLACFQSSRSRVCLHMLWGRLICQWVVAVMAAVQQEERPLDMEVLDREMTRSLVALSIFAREGLLWVYKHWNRLLSWILTQKAHVGKILATSSFHGVYHHAWSRE